MQNTDFVIEPQAIASLPVVGDTRRFPVARIFCVGRNYAEHAREMGHNPDAEPPFFFLKPTTALVTDGADFPYPALSSSVHHEVELVVAIGKGGADIAADDALSHVYGYAVGLDMTRRDVQSAAKAAGRPWETAKAFDHSAPCGAIVPASQIGHPHTGAISLSVNGAARQSGDLANMIWNIPSIIAFLSTWFALQPGDVIFTGTPAGVAAVQRGDRLVAHVAPVGDLAVQVA
jgi:fumarylpyruvate hydrolase